VLVVTALLFAGLWLARVQSDTVGDAVLLMFVVPIAILAFELGRDEQSPDERQRRRHRELQKSLPHRRRQLPLA